MSGETIIYSGRMDDNHSSGVAILISKRVARTIDEWSPISDRIITVRFWSRHIKTTVIQVYAPTNYAEDEVKENLMSSYKKC